MNIIIYSDIDNVVKSNLTYVHNFSLEGPTIFLFSSFSYNCPSRFLCVCQIHCFVVELEYNHVITIHYIT